MQMTEYLKIWFGVIQEVGPNFPFGTCDQTCANELCDPSAIWHQIEYQKEL